MLAVLYVALSIVPQLSRAICFNCNRTIEDQRSGVVRSPNYPGEYPNDCVCVWKLISRTGSAINLAVEHLNLKEISNTGNVGRWLKGFAGLTEASYEFVSRDRLAYHQQGELPLVGLPKSRFLRHAGYDYLYIYGRLSTGKKSKKLCGSSVADLDKKEYSIEATRPEPNTVTIEFTSDYSTAFSGFSIAFTMDEQETTTSVPTTEQQTATPIQQTTAATTTTITTATAAATFPTSAIFKTAHSNTNTSSFAVPVSKNTGSNNSNTMTYIVIGTASLLVAVFVLSVIWYRKRKQDKLTGNEDIIFQNLTNENEDDGTDEYGRPRENTYVEIPLLPSDETTCNGVNTRERRDSTASIDSIARAKLENAFQSFTEKTSTSSQIKHSTHQNHQVYSLAEDSSDGDTTYLSPSSVAVTSPSLPLPNLSSTSQKKSKDIEEKGGSQCSLPDGVYNVPTSPPCDPPNSRGDFLYDSPRSPSGSKPSSFSFSSSHRHSRDQEKIEGENKYLTMKGGEEMTEFSSDSESKAGDDVPGPCNDEGALYVPMK